MGHYIPVWSPDQYRCKCETQGCFMQTLCSTSEQWEMDFALTGAAVHEGWVGAQLHELQIFIGVFVETQGCFQHG